VTRLLFGILALAAILMFGLAAPAQASGAQATTPGATLRIGGIIAQSPMWRDWSNRFVASDGRIVDTGNQNLTHSEGQGYGMLLAVAAADRPAFDRIWNWTRAHLQIRQDRLLAWRWDPATRAVSDHNNAADGDILVAWALAEAGDLWNAPDYWQAAAAIAHDISRRLIVRAPNIGPVLLPAAFGFSDADFGDGPVVNPSYWVFPAFGRLAQLAPDHDWDGVRRSGVAILAAMQANAHVPTDWVSLAEGRATPARRFPARMGFEAMRIPLYLGFFDFAGANFLSEVDRAWSGVPEGLPIVRADGSASDEIAIGRGYRALRELRACALSGAAYSKDFYRSSRSAAYYPSTLHMMAVVSALLQPNACLDPAELEAIQPAAWVKAYASAPPPIVHRTKAPGPAAYVGAPFSNVDVDAAPRPRPVAADIAPLSIVNNVLAGAALVGVALAAVVGWRRSRRARPIDYFVELPQRPVIDATHERSPAPRALPHNPFDGTRSAEALQERIDIAAAASREWQRTVGVAYYRLANFEEIGNRDGAAAAQRAVDEIAAALRSRIRPSDAVAIIAPGEIAVCLCLIADAVDLASVGHRLSAALASARPLEAGRDQAFGLALYPKNGAGAACLEEARRAFHAARPELDYAPLPVATGNRRPDAYVAATGRRPRSKKFEDAPV
jgi:endoglucanase